MQLIRFSFTLRDHWPQEFMTVRWHKAQSNKLFIPIKLKQRRWLLPYTRELGKTMRPIRFVLPWGTTDVRNSWRWGGIRPVLTYRIEVRRWQLPYMRALERTCDQYGFVFLLSLGGMQTYKASVPAITGLVWFLVVLYHAWKNKGMTEE